MIKILNIWAWKPSWSCDLDIMNKLDPHIMNKLLFPHPMEAPHVIWFQLVHQFQRMSFENVDADINVDTEADTNGGPLPSL